MKCQNQYTALEDAKEAALISKGSPLSLTFSTSKIRPCFKYPGKKN